MPYFQAFTDNNKVLGRIILVGMQALHNFSDAFEVQLKKNGIVNVQPDLYYDEQSWLNALKVISEINGPNTVFALGKAVGSIIAGTWDRGKDFHSLVHSLEGFYKSSFLKNDDALIFVEIYDEKAKKIRIKGTTPYPPEYIRGLFTSIVREIKPFPYAIPKIEVEEVSVNDTTVYANITW